MQFHYNWNKIIFSFQFLRIFPTYFLLRDLLCKFPTRLFYSALASCISDEPFSLVFLSVTDVNQESFEVVTTAWSRDNFIKCTLLKYHLLIVINSSYNLYLKGKSQRCHLLKRVLWTDLKQKIGEVVWKQN